MAAELKIVPAAAAHIRPIAKGMRKADRDEVLAAAGQTPVGALTHSLRHSSLASTVLFDGRPVAMFGVVDLNILTGAGAPWMLGTDEIETHYRAFLRQSRQCRDDLLARYAVLRNFVDTRNTVSVRWLTWLGFDLFDPVEMGGVEFRLFELRAGDVGGWPGRGSARIEP